MTYFTTDQRGRCSRKVKESLLLLFVSVGTRRVCSLRSDQAEQSPSPLHSLHPNFIAREVKPVFEKGKLSGPMSWHVRSAAGRRHVNVYTSKVSDSQRSRARTLSRPSINTHLTHEHSSCDQHRRSRSFDHNSFQL